MQTVAKMNELRRNSQKFTAAPEPPSARASSGVASPRTRSNAPVVKSTGSSEAGSLNSDFEVENAVRSIQYNGKIVIRMRMIIAVQARARPQLKGLRFFSWTPPAPVTRVARDGAVVVAMSLPSQARSDSPAFSTFSWIRATDARMMNKITDRALA